MWKGSLLNATLAVWSKVVFGRGTFYSLPFGLNKTEDTLEIRGPGCKTKRLKMFTGRVTCAGGAGKHANQKWIKLIDGIQVKKCWGSFVFKTLCSSWIRFGHQICCWFFENHSIPPKLFIHQSIWAWFPDKVASAFDMLAPPFWTNSVFEVFHR